MPKRRELTKVEKEFIKEGEALSFTVHFQEDGTPFLMGACDNQGALSMHVLENPEPDGESSCYYLA